MAAGSPAGRRTKRDATGPRLWPSRPANTRRDGGIPSLRLADRIELLFDVDTLAGLFSQGRGAAFLCSRGFSSSVSSLIFRITDHHDSNRRSQTADEMNRHSVLAELAD